jgi:hypothetical protein
MLYLKLVLFLAVLSTSLTGNIANAGEHPNHTLISSLRDGTVLKILNRIEVGTTDYDGRFYYRHTRFENQVNYTGEDLDGLDYYNSQVVIRTNSLAAITDNYLDAGHYCLDRSKSTFASNSKRYLFSSYDKLFFRVCSTYEPAFALYVIAGVNLRTSAQYHGLTIRHFNDQVGGSMVLIK